MENLMHRPTELTAPRSVLTILVSAYLFSLAGCGGGGQTIIVEEAQAVDRIREATIMASIAAGTLSEALDAAISAHDNAKNERSNALLSGDFSLAGRAESVAATSVRAVGVTIEQTAGRADALRGAGADAPRNIDLIVPLATVSEFANTIAELHDQLNSRVESFTEAARNVQVRSVAVSAAVESVATTSDALAAADSISVARSSLDDALAEAVTADVLLAEILQVLKFDAERLQAAARTIEFELPSVGVPRRDLE